MDHTSIFDDKNALSYIGIRARAFEQRAKNVCYRRMNPKPDGDCWCKVLREKDTDSELPCPPAFVEPT